MKTIVKSFLFFVLILCCNKQVCAQKEKDSVSAYIKLINNPQQNSDLLKGILFFKKKQIQDKLHNKKLRVVYDLTYISRAERKIGVLNDSENSAVDALLILDELGENKNQEYRISLYNHLGIVSRELGKYDSSLEYYKKALEMESRRNEISTILNNIGNVFYEQSKFKSAIDYFNQSYQQSIRLNDSLNIARAQSNLGKAQSKLNTPEALKNIEQGLLIRQEKKNQQGIVTSYLDLYEYYKDKNQTTKAKFYAVKALNIAKESNILDYKLSSLQAALNLSNDPNVTEFIELNSELKKGKQNNRNEYAALKYNKDKEIKRANKAEIKLQASELKNEKQKRLNLLYLTIAGFIVFSSGFLYTVLKSRHKKEKLQEVYKTETRISKKVHDEVANDVYHVMTKLQSKTNISEDVIDDLEGIYSKTRDISRENATININENFDEQLSDLLLSYKSSSVSVITKGLLKVNLNVLSNEKKMVLYRVLHELMVNMKKHSQASIIVISFKEFRNKIHIEYKDNGVGVNLKKRNGLLNTENRMQSISGTITFESETNKGFTAKLIV